MVKRLFYELTILKEDGIKEYLNLLRIRKVRHLKEEQKNKAYLAKTSQIRNMESMFIRGYEMPGVNSIGFLIGGIMTNYQEWRFYRKTKNIFAMPTYFSFFGLLNFQKKGEKINFWGDKDILGYLRSNCEDPRQLQCDTHTLTKIDNFCLDNGHLKILDYGRRSLAPFLEINGEKFYNNFKIPD